jgi:hypothetical protein
MPLVLRLAAAAAVLLSVVAAATAPAARAADPARTCSTPSLSARILETPSVMLTYARDAKRRSEFKTRSCWRGQRTPAVLGTDYDVSFVSGGVTPLQLVAGRWLLVEDWERSSSDEGSQSSASRRLVDLKTRGATVSAGSDAVAGPAGLLATGGRGLVLRAPGRAQRTISPAADAVSLALGERTAYWSDAAGAPSSAAVPAQLRRAPEPAGRPSPRDARGPCEPRGSRTLVRVAGGRLYRDRSGRARVCSGKTKQTLELGRGEVVAVLAPRLAVFRQAERYAVVNVVKARIAHAATLDASFRGAAATAEGILVADGSGIRWVRGRTSTPLAPDAGTDPAVAEPFLVEQEDAEETRVPARAYWTMPDGPRSAPLP